MIATYRPVKAAAIRMSEWPGIFLAVMVGKSSGRQCTVQVARFSPLPRPMTTSLSPVRPVSSTVAFPSGYTTPSTSSGVSASALARVSVRAPSPQPTA